MENKKVYKLGLLAIFGLMLLPFITATSTLNKPAASTNHTGTLDVNCTTDLANAMNATFWYNATGVSDATLTTVNNDTAGDTDFSSSDVDISSLTDKADYSFWCSVINETNSQENSSINTGITIDNTDPVITLFIDLAGDTQSYGGLIEYSCTTTDAIDSSPTEVFAVTHPSDDTTSSTSLTLQSTHLTFDDTDFPGDYVFTCTSTDYTGNSASSSNTVTVSSAGRARVIDNNDGGIGNNWIWILAIVLLLIWMSRRKK